MNILVYININIKLNIKHLQSVYKNALGAQRTGSKISPEMFKIDGGGKSWNKYIIYHWYFFLIFSCLFRTSIWHRTFHLISPTAYSVTILTTNHILLPLILLFAFSHSSSVFFLYFSPSLDLPSKLIQRVSIWFSITLYHAVLIFELKRRNGANLPTIKIEFILFAHVRQPNIIYR